MKHLTFTLTIMMSLACGYSQAQGLSQGQRVVTPSVTPQQAEKRCEKCGIRMYNATNPWQHETWCPYYRSQGSGSSSGSSSSVSTANTARMAVVGSVMSGVGELLSGWIGNLIRGKKKEENNQNSNDIPLQRLNEPYHSYGNYYMVPMNQTKRGTPMYPAIVNRMTGQYVHQPLTRIVKPEENASELLNKDARFVTPYVWALQFLKPETGYDPVFEGLIWIKYEDLTNKYFSEQTGKWENYYSGIFKIEDEQLVPLFASIGQEDSCFIKIFPLKGLPYIAMEKKTFKETYKEVIRKKKKEVIKSKEVDSITTYIYDSDFEYAGKLDGSIGNEYGYDSNHLYHKDGSRDTLDLSGITGGTFKDELGRWGIKDKFGDIVVPCVMTNDEAKNAFRDRNVWSFSRFCKQYVKKKSDFETQAEYDARMSDPQLQQKYIASKGLDAKFSKGYRLSLGRYDAETETFPVNGYMLVVQGTEPVVADIPWNDFQLTVPRSEAEAFQNSWNKIIKESLENAKMGIRYDAVSIDDITFTMPDGKTYSWQREKAKD